VVGRTERIDALSAAFLNAASANVHDFCDTHLRTVIHPTAPVAPALLALAELRPVSGPDLLLAFILGNEVQPALDWRSRPAIMPGAAHHFDLRLFGAAAAAASWPRWTRRQMVWALAPRHAILRPVRVLGTPAKGQRRQRRAQRSVVGVVGGEGFDGPPEPLAGVQGFYHAMGETPIFVGHRWPRRKLGDHGHVIQAISVRLRDHPVLDCVLDWRRDNPKAEVTRIVVRGNLPAQRPHRPANISTGRESQVSVQHAVAAALVTGKAGLEQFTDACAHDPEVLRCASKVEVVRDGVLSRRGGSRDHHRRRHDPQAVAVGGARQRRQSDQRRGSGGETANAAAQVGSAARTSRR